MAIIAGYKVFKDREAQNENERKITTNFQNIITKTNKINEIIEENIALLQSFRNEVTNNLNNQIKTNNALKHQSEKTVEIINNNMKLSNDITTKLDKQKRLIGHLWEETNELTNNINKIRSQQSILYSQQNNLIRNNQKLLFRLEPVSIKTTISFSFHEDLAFLRLAQHIKTSIISGLQKTYLDSTEFKLIEIVGIGSPTAVTYWKVEKDDINILLEQGVDRNNFKIGSQNYDIAALSIPFSHFLISNSDFKANHFDENDFSAFLGKTILKVILLSKENGPCNSDMLIQFFKDFNNIDITNTSSNRIEFDFENNRILFKYFYENLVIEYGNREIISVIDLDDMFMRVALPCSWATLSPRIDSFVIYSGKDPKREYNLDVGGFSMENKCGEDYWCSDKESASALMVTENTFKFIYQFKEKDFFQMDQLLFKGMKR